MMRQFKQAAMVLLCMGTMAAGAEGQSATLAAVRGSVADESGSAVEGARVQLRDAASGRTVTAVSDTDGRFFMPNLTPGRAYEISVEAVGFLPGVVGELVVQAGRIHDVSLTLEAGVIPLPGIEARAAGGSPLAARGGVSVSVDAAELQRYPSFDRNLVDAASLSPLAVRTREGFSIAGQNPRFNLLHIDGIRHQDLLGAGSAGGPGAASNAKPLPLDAVEQLQMQVAPFDVRSSGFSGGLINAVTRAGTNDRVSRVFAHYRDHRFAGSQEASPQRTPLGGSRNHLVGATLSGPIRRDNAHYLLALELEGQASPSPGFNLGSADPLATRVAPQSAARLAAILQHRYGIDAGSHQAVIVKNPRQNVFGRLDWQFGAHRFTARHNSAWGELEVPPTRDAAGPYDFASQVRRHSTSSHAGSVQVISEFGGRLSNDFVVSLHHARESVSPLSSAPAIEVLVASQFDTLTVQRVLRAGGHTEAHANDASQLALEVQNAVTTWWGHHVLTVGAGAELATFRATQLSSATGRFVFPNLTALEADLPARFERTLAVTGDQTTRLEAFHFSAFVQDHWTVSNRLTLSVGLRADLPYLRVPVEPHPAVSADLGLAAKMNGLFAPLLAPRLAATWIGDDNRTRVRAGAGVFTGRPPYIWLAHALNRSGGDFVVMTCELDRAPRLGAADSPEECRPPRNSSSGAPIPGSARYDPVVAVLDRDFAFPQDLRLALGADRQFAGGAWVASADLVFTRAMRQVSLRDANISAPLGSTSHELGHSDGFGFEERASVGTPTNWGFTTTRPSDAFSQVVLVGNGTGNRALSFSMGLNGRLAQADIRAAWTLSRSIDLQSLTAPDPATNLANVPISADPALPLAALSDFDRPHRVLLSLAAPSPVAGITLAALYSAQSGAPFTYVYDIDINGDGAPGPGRPHSYNDPIYVPADAADFPGALGSAAAFEQFVAQEPCLQRWRGRVLPRNACRGPATHRLDLQGSRSFEVGGRRARVQLDLLNFLSVLGLDAAEVRAVPSAVPLLSVQTPRSWALTNESARDPLQATFVGPAARESDGSLHVLPVHTIDHAASRWQARLGLSLHW
jgi:hypothetical protein